MKSGAVTGTHYIMTKIYIYILIKQLFILNFEQGTEVLIPVAYRMEKMPSSFQFYDPIICIIRDHLSEFRRQTFLLKKQLGYMFADNAKTVDVGNYQQR